MSSVFRIVMILPALVMSGYSLSCKQCLSATSSCVGDSGSATCASDSACGVLHSESSVGLQTYMWLCLLQSQCDMKGTLGLLNGVTIRMATSCCNNTDNCIPTLPNLPPSNSKSNGLTCPYCASLSSVSCDASDTVKCTGDQKMCFLEVTNVTGISSVQTAVRGCASESICGFGGYSYPINIASTEVKYNCTGVASGVGEVFLYPSAFTGLLMLKFFLKLCQRQLFTIIQILKTSIMLSVFGILGILCAFVASGNSLSCTICTSKSTSCSGRSRMCPNGSLCGAHYTYVRRGGYRYARTCTPEKLCNMTGSVSFIGGEFRMSVWCCVTDHCTPTHLSMSAGRRSRANGLICRSCISTKSSWCYTSETMRCGGNEDMCFLQTKKVRGKEDQSTAVRGCATKSMCDLDNQSTSANGVSIEYKMICTSGGLTLQKGFYVPVVICLVLLKVF
ncbi:uncharacterized protein [Hyperolius riggenbachi]|uniref:uncharacterized protein n=1 Tax=Hyperolius riggenbachi TaxID=752182 RepID=UPI0035A39C89